MSRRTKTRTDDASPAVPAVEAEAPASSSTAPADGPTVPAAQVRELVFRVGGVDAAVQHLLRALPLPILSDELESFSWCYDALEQAADTRVGVVLVGPGDSGKSVGLRWAARQFEAEELRLVREHAPYRPRRVVRLCKLAVQTPLDFLIALYRAAFDATPSLRLLGRAKRAEELFAEIVERLRDEDVAAVVVDDADALPDAVIEQLTGLMARSTDEHPDQLGEATLATPGGTVAPLGVGVVLAGTAKLEARISRGGEVGNAWKRVCRVSAVPAAQVPAVLARLLPAFGVASTTLGPLGWATFVHQHVTFGRATPIGTLDHVARQYVRRLVIDAVSAGRLVRSLAEVPWDPAMLEQIRTETLVPRATAAETPEPSSGSEEAHDAAA